MPAGLPPFLISVGSIPQELYLMAETMPYLPIPARKVLLDLCRIQLPLRGSHHLWNAFNKELYSSYQIILRLVPRTMTLAEMIYEWLDPLIERPVCLSLASQIIRMSPFDDYGSVQAELISGIEKELGPTQRLRKPQRVDYSSIFGHSSFSGPIAQGIPEANETVNEIRRRLRQWKQEIKGTILFPKYNRVKNVSAATQGIYCRQLGLPSNHYVTTLDLERAYHHYSLVTTGPCEVRTAWTYSQLKPRVYYAQGGDAYFASRYVQTIFNSLSSVIETTDVRYRFQSNRLNPIRPTETLMIYDYSNFTSEMDEQVYFLYELATFCDDTDVVIVDTRTGPRQVSLGHLIREYAATCNDNPEFDVSGIYGIKEYWNHRVAGMLGVYGNIVSCTTLHGMLLAIIADGIDRANCVGDDAEVAFEETRISIPSFSAALQIGGSIAADKYRIWRYRHIDQGGGEGWKYLKRPIDRIGEQVVTGYLIDLPGLDIILDLHDDYHTRTEESVNQRQKILIKQSARVLDLMVASPSTFTDADRILFRDYTRRAFKVMKIPVGNIPSPGGFPYLTPMLTLESFEEEWKSATLGQDWPDYILRPEYSSDIDEERPVVWRLEYSFKAVGSAQLSLLEDLGYLISDHRRIAVLCTDAEIEKFKLFLNGGLHRLSLYTVVDLPPHWIR